MTNPIISHAVAREASEALLLAMTAARALAGMDRRDPEAQLYRRHALDDIDRAVKILENLHPLVDYDTYRISGTTVELPCGCIRTGEWCDNDDDTQSLRFDDVFSRCVHHDEATR